MAFLIELGYRQYDDRYRYMKMFLVSRKNMKHNVAKQNNLETTFKSVLCFNTTGAVDKIKIYLKQTNNITTMHGLINNKQVHTENTKHVKLLFNLLRCSRSWYKARIHVCVYESLYRLTSISCQSINNIYPTNNFHYNQQCLITGHIHTVKFAFN